MRSNIAALRIIFSLGTTCLTAYHDCMDNYNHTFHSNDDTNQHVTHPQAPLVSEMLPAFLDYLRVEDHHTPATLIRYESHIQKFITTVGDCLITGITSEKLSLYKRRLLDQSLAPATMAAMLSGLRSFLRYLKEVRGFQVYDSEKVRRTKIPKHDVEYLTKEEVQRFCGAIPTHTQSGIRDRALAEVLCITGMRIAEALSLNRAQIDWETQTAQIVGKGNKPRRVYFTDSALAWIRQYLDVRHDDHPALFVTQGDNTMRLKAQGIWKRFHRYAAQAGIGKRVYPPYAPPHYGDDPISQRMSDWSHPWTWRLGILSTVEYTSITGVQRANTIAAVGVAVRPLLPGIYRSCSQR
jgi:integrase/recombinase XerD